MYSTCLGWGGGRGVGSLTNQNCDFTALKGSSPLYFQLIAIYEPISNALYRNIGILHLSSALMNNIKIFRQHSRIFNKFLKNNINNSITW